MPLHALIETTELLPASAQLLPKFHSCYLLASSKRKDKETPALAGLPKKMALAQINLMGSAGNCLNEGMEGTDDEYNVLLLTVMELTQKDYFYPMEKKKRTTLRSREENGLPCSPASCGRHRHGCSQSSSKLLLERNCYAPIPWLFLQDGMPDANWETLPVPSYLHVPPVSCLTSYCSQSGWWLRSSAPRDS